MHKSAAIALLLAAAIPAACATQSASSPTQAGLTPALRPELAISFTFPKNTIGAELPGEGVGTEKDPTWGTVGGYTQSGKAQVLAFPPGTTVTFKNLSTSLPHTLDVVKKVAGPPAHFPSSPTLPIGAAGNGVLGVGYASGSISPGKTVSIKLLHAGNYLIGCAFHYHEGMQDVIRVIAHATPGPHQ